MVMESSGWAKAKLADAHVNMRWPGVARLDLSQSSLLTAGMKKAARLAPGGFQSAGYRIT
jgi:hypothetical protein